MTKNVNKADTKQQKVIYRWVIADVYTQLIIMTSRFMVL
jgi:hypothetical protein